MTCPLLSVRVRAQLSWGQGVHCRPCFPNLRLLQVLVGSAWELACLPLPPILVLHFLKRWILPVPVHRHCLRLLLLELLQLLMERVGCCGELGSGLCGRHG